MHNLNRLLDIMTQLRHPQLGCPWDREQDFQTLIPCTLEEAYEVVDAIERNDHEDLLEELGDLLLQVVFHAQIARERELFDFEQVAGAIADKLVRRHPHVFADAELDNSAAVKQRWEQIKQAEREAKGKHTPQDSILSGIVNQLPALIQAEKLQNKAARHGFDWPEIAPVFAKVREELAEIEGAYESGDQAHIREEVGDLLFVAVNLARHLGVDAESALREANRKFTRRIQHMEQRLGEQDKTFQNCELLELDELWNAAKQHFKQKDASTYS